MRVIGGKARGVRLSEFSNRDIRPTLDRVKESVFNRLRPVIRGSRFLDLFSGTGGIGIEALSEGAGRVVFIDQDPAVCELIRKNLEKCQFSQGSRTDCGAFEVLQQSALSAIDKLQIRNEQFDIVYLDPPYASEAYQATLESLAASRLLAPDVQVIVERHRRNTLQTKYGRLGLLKEKNFGDTGLSFFEIVS